MSRRALPCLLGVVLLGATASPAAAATRPLPPAPSGLQRLALGDRVSGAKGVALPGRAAASPTLDPALAQASGPVRVVVRLRQEPVAALDRRTPGADRSARREQADRVRSQADGVFARARQLDRRATRRATLTNALSAVLLNTDAAAARELAKDPRVLRVTPVRTYSMDDSEVTSYVGSRAVSNSGSDGTGVTVAVIDSGVDYTHAKLGGAGTNAAYARAYGEAPPPASTRPTPPTPGRPTTSGPTSPRTRSSGASTSSGRSGRSPGTRSAPTPTRSTGRGTAPTSPTSSPGSTPAPARTRATPATPPARSSSRTRSARPSPPPARAARCCRPSTPRWTRTGTATPGTAPT